MKKLILLLALVLVPAFALADVTDDVLPTYTIVKDSQGRPIYGYGLRPVSHESLPVGMPFFDKSNYSMYYWNGTGWTGAVAAGAVTSSGGTFTGPILLPDGAVGAPALAFASDTDSGLFRAGSGAVTLALNAGGWHQWTTGAYNIAGTSALLQLGGDVNLYRDGAANVLQMGTDAASATSQTFKGADSTGNGTAGGILTLRGGAGTAGDAKGGNLNLAGGAAAGTGEQGVVAIVDTGTKPTCAAGIRGGFWYEQGGAGVADTFEVCAKAAAGDTYAWRTLATIP